MLRAGPDDPLEPVAEGGRRAETDLVADPVHRVRGGLQQVLRPPDPRPVQPLQRRACRSARGSAGSASGCSCPRARRCRPGSGRGRPGRRASAAAAPSWSRCGTGGRSCTMNWACPPSRSSGMTDSRAASAATAEPWSRRIRCRQRSSPAAAPAEVRNWPLSTYSTSGSTSTSGIHRGEQPGGGPVRGRPPAVQQPGGGQHEGAGADRRDPGAARRGRAQGIAPPRPAPAAAASAQPGRMIVSARSSASSPCGARSRKAPASTSGDTAQTRTSVGRLAARPAGSGRRPPAASPGRRRSPRPEPVRPPRCMPPHAYWRESVDLWRSSHCPVTAHPA